MLTDALGIRRDLGPEDDIAAVRRKRGRKEKCPTRGKLPWFCRGLVRLKILD